MSEKQADELLQRAVRMRGIRLGRVVDVVFDVGATRVLGLDVLCGDEVHRFLPYSATEMDDRGDFRIGSSLLLLDAQEREFYRRHGRSLVAAAGADLRGLRIRRDGTAGAAPEAGPAGSRC